MQQGQWYRLNKAIKQEIAHSSRVLTAYKDVKQGALVQNCDEWGYLAVGLCVGLPPIFLPMFLQSSKERSKPWQDRHWVKANVWIAIYSFIGNYFWTHYFYQLLGANYTFPAHLLNGVLSLSVSHLCLPKKLLLRQLLHIVSVHIDSERLYTRLKGQLCSANEHVHDDQNGHIEHQHSSSLVSHRLIHCRYQLRCTS